jgi:hypothetical protein
MSEPKESNQSYCEYCLTSRDNTIGISDIKRGVWVCSGGCHSLYLYDTGCVKASPEAALILNKMRHQCYNVDRINNKRQRMTRSKFVY